MSKIPLAGAIQELRQQLIQAQLAGLDEKGLTFRLKPIELEFSIGVTAEGEGGAGIKFWLLSLDAKGKYQDATTQKIKLVLEPVDKDGKSFEVGRDEGGRPR